MGKLWKKTGIYYEKYKKIELFFLPGCRKDEKCAKH